MQIDMLMTMHRSKSKPEIAFQYGGRPFSITGSSYISAVDWDISSKFGMEIHFYLLKHIPSLIPYRKVDFRLYGPILKNRYDVITPPTIVRLLRNLAGRCKMICRWLCIGRSRNRKKISNMAAVRFPKPEVVLSQPWIEISYRNLACKSVSYTHLTLPTIYSV